VAVDIDEGDAATVQIEGSTCLYVLTVAEGQELEASVFQNTPEDLAELKVELDTAVKARRTIILLRAGTYMGAVKRWESLEPEIFARRLRGP
jgi:hypothetical protein